MPKSLLTILIVFCTLQFRLTGQELKYYEATQYPLLGKPIDDSASERYYMRLPDSIQGKIERPYLYTLGSNTAGMAIRFRTASPIIGAKWKSVYQTLMNHQTPVGSRGLDLYTLEDDSKTWTFVNTARPNLWNAVTETVIINNMEPKMREYMLYLPLYDGVDSLYIGINSEYTVEQPAIDLPKREKPIIFYGTSILQGGCANRPGMAHTNILERWLNRETINLGFSGMGQLDLPVAHVIANITNPGMVVLDMVPNVSVAQMDTLLVSFYNIIRTAHPDVPMLFIEDPEFPHCRFDKAARNDVDTKNACLKKHFEYLKKSGEKNIYYLDGKNVIGNDAEATVDGLHFTDLGFMRFSEILYPIINKHALK
ncbi:MAG: SGNH/GDSL hydrolase family protein [Muribaculaceae bacterium]|nr:SGNH/GDSL hydrolase family protein [Muribaculaceae bacterium]